MGVLGKRKQAPEVDLSDEKRLKIEPDFSTSAKESTQGSQEEAETGESEHADEEEQPIEEQEDADNDKQREKKEKRKVYSIHKSLVIFVL